MMTFEELGVRNDLLHAIKDMGFENPMPVQEKVIPHLLNEDGDVIALAQTGTGKTAAFGLPVLQRIDVKQVTPQALIIAPTRAVPTDRKRPVGLLQIHARSQSATRVRRFKHRKPDTLSAQGSARDRCHSGTTDGPHTPRRSKT